MPDTVNVQSDKHFKYLDSARGIAALMVFGSHFIARCFQEKINVHWWFLLFNGNDAVSFFFVLSGFVLSYKYIVPGRDLEIKKFYVSRVFRLFPAYFVVVLLSALYFYREHLDVLTLRDVFLYNKDEFWEEALLFRFHNTLYYPGWTLTIEMLGSFLMPFYIALALKDKRYIPYLIVVTIIIGNNIYFSYLFLFGIIASSNYATITSDSLRQTKWYKYRAPIIIAAIALFSIRQIDGLSPLGSTFKYLQSYIGIDFFNYTGLACFVFLVCILHSKKVQAFLSGRVLVFLGKISYSVYLVHVLVINELFLFIGRYVTWPPDPLKFGFFTVAAVAGVILSATVLHYAVEVPFMRLGKRVVARMKPGLIVRRTAGDEAQ